MDDFEFDKAIDEVWLMIRSLNQYIDTVQPWQIAKNIGKDPEAESHMAEALGNCVGALIQIGDLLVPFLPQSAAIIHTTFETGVVKASEALYPKKYLHTAAPNNPTK